jgi:hypothetical protein
MGVQWDSASAVYRFQKSLDSIKREVLSNILLEFGIPKKLVWLIKMCLNEIYSKVRIAKNLMYFLVGMD